jgi:hypothetical protein
LFCKKVNNVFNIKSSLSKLVSTRRSIVLSLPLSVRFPVCSGFCVGVVALADEVAVDVIAAVAVTEANGTGKLMLW